MKLLKKLPEELKIFFFIVAVKRLLSGIPLDVFREGVTHFKDYEKQKRFEDIHKKLANKQIISAEELEFLIEYERKRQWEKM